MTICTMINHYSINKPYAWTIPNCKHPPRPEHGSQTRDEKCFGINTKHGIVNMHCLIAIQLYRSAGKLYRSAQQEETRQEKPPG